MNTQVQRAFDTRPRRSRLPPMRDTRLLGRILLDMGAITSEQLDVALEQQRKLDAQLGDIFIGEGMIRPAQLMQALAQQHGLSVADLDATPPKDKLQGLLTAELCLSHMAVPWKQIGDILLVATAHPDKFEHLKTARDEDGLVLLPVLAEEAQIRAAINRLHGTTLALRAERRVPDALSCRHLGHSRLGRAMFGLIFCAALVWVGASNPNAMAHGLALAATVTLALSIGLKLLAGLAQLRHEFRSSPLWSENVAPLRLPKVSVLVPLLREKEITDALIRRLSRLTYPKSLLDVVLVLEAKDDVTKDTLARTKLPAWMRVVEVPEGSGLTTKPRALNYALDYCRAQIVGIWDAEDAPAPDQIETIVTRFHSAPKEVVCLQGQLDYYNARSNWIARCFAIEYATWWRLIMPGLARLGFVIPLGGTTLFFRRKELEDLGGWDAHNVTEDADLGVRLARAGYRTELIETVTQEEATCRIWPWIRQRSRWLKGFAITWGVHMRNPMALWRDLGTLRFIGLQLFFLSALSQFLLAPVFWGFWLVTFGLGNPFGEWIVTAGIIGFFLACELAALGLNLLAVRRPAHRHLMLWTPVMGLYFVMASVAVYKAMWELVARPFFWDKTQHGISTPEDQDSSPRASAS